MKLLLKVIIGSVVLLTVAFAQEPKHAVVAQEPAAPSAASTTQMIATGSPPRPAPAVEPKALPPLNPSLGEIARKARARARRGPEGASRTCGRRAAERVRGPYPGFMFIATH